MDEFVEDIQQVDSQEEQCSAVHEETVDVLVEQEAQIEEVQIVAEGAAEAKPKAKKKPSVKKAVVEEEPVAESDAETKDDADVVVAAEAEVSEEPVAEGEAVAEEESVSAENLEDIEQKRSIVNNDAEMHRRLRDDLNNQTKDWKMKRDALNFRVRELVDEAGKCREERDSFNQKVRETKVVRDEWNQKVSALKDQIAILRPEKFSEDKGELSVKQLRKQLQGLEYTQQTSSLGKDKENEIVKQISVLARQIDEKEKSLEQTGEIGEIVQQLRDAKVQAEACHHQVSEYAEAAQLAHDGMLKHYEEADALRKEADAAQAKFIECKHEADEEHRKHIEQIKSVHEMDKDVAGMRNKKTAAKKKRVDTEFRKEAKEIFERFKSGDKLSTDDLMALQKSGYL